MNIQSHLALAISKRFMAMALRGNRELDKMSPEELRSYRHLNEMANNHLRAYRITGEAHFIR